MKHPKFISIILLFLLSFLGSTAFYNYSSELNHCQTQDIFLTSEIPPVLTSTLSMSNDVDVHFLVKNKIKKRVQNSETSSIKNTDYSNLVCFKTLKDSIIYSIATIYENQRHTHLHLYQLF